MVNVKMVDSLSMMLLLLQSYYYILWPVLLVFIIIILLASCIVCAAIQDQRESSRPQPYVRASTQDPWVPVQKVSAKPQPWKPSRHDIDVIVCSCGKWNSPNQTSCWNCNASLAMQKRQTFIFETAERCTVCGFWVYPGERVVLCPACHAQGHRAHMLEYVKAKGNCPVCNQKLNLNDILEAIPKLGETLEEKGSR